MSHHYPFAEVEPRWQAYWEEHRTFRAGEPGTGPKFYCLDMYPYPSGAGLHVGHAEGYTATDIVSRYKRMRGFNVMHPTGWDAFGLPAEQYAIKTGVHPAVTTAQNVANYRRQMKRIGLSYDWDREVDTTDPAYYRWTQWIFLKLFERGLAYVAEVPVNWCPELGTVLANEEVVDGKSEIGGFDVVRRPMRQWVLKITAYAERLLADEELAAEAGAVIKIAGDLEIDAALLGPESLDTPDLLKIAGDSAEGVFAASVYNAENESEASKHFLDAFSKRYGYAPDATAAQSYQALKVLAKAIEQAGSTDPSRIADAMRAIQWDGATGLVSFDERGELETSHVIVKKVKNGKFVATD